MGQSGNHRPTTGRAAPLVRGGSVWINGREGWPSIVAREPSGCKVSPRRFATLNGGRAAVGPGRPSAGGSGSFGLALAASPNTVDARVSLIFNVLRTSLWVLAPKIPTWRSRSSSRKAGWGMTSRLELCRVRFSTRSEYCPLSRWSVNRRWSPVLVRPTSWMSRSIPPSIAHQEQAVAAVLPGGAGRRGSTGSTRSSRRCRGRTGRPSPGRGCRASRPRWMKSSRPVNPSSERRKPRYSPTSTPDLAVQVAPGGGQLEDPGFGGRAGGWGRGGLERPIRSRGAGGSGRSLAPRRRARSRPPTLGEVELDRTWWAGSPGGGSIALDELAGLDLGARGLERDGPGRRSGPPAPWPARPAVRSPSGGRRQGAREDPDRGLAPARRPRRRTRSPGPPPSPGASGP